MASPTLSTVECARSTLKGTAFGVHKCPSQRTDVGVGVLHFPELLFPARQHGVDHFGLPLRQDRTGFLETRREPGRSAEMWGSRLAHGSKRCWQAREILVKNCLKHSSTAATVTTGRASAVYGQSLRTAALFLSNSPRMRAACMSGREHLIKQLRFINGCCMRTETHRCCSGCCQHHARRLASCDSVSNPQCKEAQLPFRVQYHLYCRAAV